MLIIFYYFLLTYKMNDIIKWLLIKPSKYSDDTNDKLVDQLFNELISLLNTMKEFNYEFEYEDLKKIFTIYCFDKFSVKYEDEIDLFLDLKYNQDIVDLHLNFIEICKSYGSSLFQNKEDTSFDLLNLINTSVYQIEDYDEDETIDISEDEME